MQNEGNRAALEGIRVLDLSRFIAGPHCAMQLADLGADVVKVERRSVGDDTRATLPQIEGESLYFMTFNRNKRSVTLNFRDPEAQKLLRELVCGADILIENFRPGTMEKMGCGWEVLHELNPRLIMARISGYGQSGRLAGEPCFDGIAQASSGLMSLTGHPDGPPTVSGSFVVDYCSALYATIGIMAALERRHKTGEGQLVDVSLMGSATSLLMTAIPEQLLLGKTMTRKGNKDRYSAPGEVYKTADDQWVYLISGNNALFPRLTAVMGREDLLEHPHFSTLEKRMENRSEIESIVAKWVASQTADQVIALARQAEIPAARVANLDEVAHDPYVREAGHIINVEHPTVGSFPTQGFPIRLSESPASIRCAAPTLGADTEAILAEWLGKNDEELARLRERCVV
ncbi:CaiB/BaiF CoA transferase family protein [Cupriavidus pinatubonensis]|uniref:Succinyl-CoA--L-malate CoA-transferase beta subunit n=1 Tax=Cupriavidus pinatubonensis TaxID=248026 RepID=A0ABN7YF67_9BURK|nr:CoA transferase [Cupriavidus pinatubonensis]CAG9170786.1 Succinyl-CoA--L-malate CoA-transferase beta subunit [Cupriavidus pinatubonensis]